MEIDLALKVKDSLSMPISVFLTLYCKVITIKRTPDTPDSGKCILITDDVNYPTANRKLGKLFEHIQKTPIIPTMTGNLQEFTAYPSIQGSVPYSDNLRSQAAQIQSSLHTQPNASTPAIH